MPSFPYPKNKPLNSFFLRYLWNINILPSRFTIFEIRHRKLPCQADTLPCVARLYKTTQHDTYLTSLDKFFYQRNKCGILSNSHKIFRYGKQKEDNVKLPVLGPLILNHNESKTWGFFLYLFS